MPGLSELQHRINERIKATPPVRVIVISFVLILGANKLAKKTTGSGIF